MSNSDIVSLQACHLFWTTLVSSLILLPFSPSTFWVLVAMMMISVLVGVTRTCKEEMIMFQKRGMDSNRARESPQLQSNHPRPVPWWGTRWARPWTPRRPQTSSSSTLGPPWWPLKWSQCCRANQKRSVCKCWCYTCRKKQWSDLDHWQLMCKCYTNFTHISFS